MVIAVFRSRLRPENEEEFLKLADELMETAVSMPGFVSYKLYRGEDGERCSVIEFETAEELLAWRELPIHSRAQQEGRERFYASYSLQVGEVSRESWFDTERGLRSRRDA